MTRKRRLRAGIDYAMCSTSSSSRTSSTTATRRKRRRFSKSEPLPPSPAYATILDLPQELFHQVMLPFTSPSVAKDNAATILAVASTCRTLQRRASLFASSVLLSDHNITTPVDSPLTHLTRQISSVCVHCGIPVLKFRQERFTGFTCCTMCDSRYHTKISEQRAIRDYRLSKRHLTTLRSYIFEEHNPFPTGSPRPSRQNSPSADDGERSKYYNDANNEIAVYLEAEVAALANEKSHGRRVYPTLRTPKNSQDSTSWAVLQRTFEQNGLFISPQMYQRWTTRKKASPQTHHIARDIKLLKTIFEDIPFPDKLYNLWWRERFTGWMTMNLAQSIEDDDTRIQFHELFERTFNRKLQSRSEILKKFDARNRAWAQRSPRGVKDEPWNIVHFPAFVSKTLESSPGSAASKKKVDRENEVLWQNYLLTVRKYSEIATHFEFILLEPRYWDFIGAEDTTVSLEEMVERCLNLKAQREGKSYEDNLEIGSRLRYGRGQKLVVHRFGGVPV